VSRSKRPKCSAGRGCWVCALADTSRKQKRAKDKVRAEVLSEANFRADDEADAAARAAEDALHDEMLDADTWWSPEDEAAEPDANEAA